MNYEFIIDINNNFDKVIIFGSGALPKSNIEKFKGHPVFHRISWDYNHSQIYYNDPTRKLSDELTGGWGLGTQETWYLENISKIIKIIADNYFEYENPNNKYNNLIFYGSSMGGYMSLQLSILVKNSISIAEMPQFNLYNWKYWPILKRTIFYDLTQKEIEEQFSHRLKIIDLINREKYIPNTYLILDCSVQSDFENQYNDFFNHLNELPYEDNNNINKIKIRIDGKNIGHEQLDYINSYESIEKICMLLDYDKGVNKRDISQNFKYHQLLLKNQSLLLKYTNARIDIKNFGNKDNNIKLLKTSDKKLSKHRPEWFKDDAGTGLILHSLKGELELEFKCVNDGLLKIILRGPYFLDKNKNIIPIYIDYESLYINNKKIFENNTLVWHNQPYIYERNVKNNEIITLKITWSPINRNSSYKL